MFYNRINKESNKEQILSILRQIVNNKITCGVMKMKRIIILLSFISILLCSCNQQTANDSIPNEPPKNTEKNSDEDEVDYSNLHELALMYEKYAWGYGIDENILYGRFVIDEDGNKHWLYPVKYTAVPYILKEDDIPEILSDVLTNGEQMYRIVNVENIYDMDEVISIYSANGYSKLFEEKSYDLASSEDIVKMSERVNSRLYNEIHATYNLMCDIDMSGIEFVPIGKYSDYTVNYDHRVHNKLGFCGIFNGNNHSISNLSVLKEYEESFNMENSIGFFSVLGQEASVKNLSIINADIDYTGEKASIAAGILAGRMYGSNVENCKVSGTVKGTSNVGGFAGIAESGNNLKGDEIKCIIADCHADVEVYGENWLGGFIGSNSADIVHLFFININK